MTNGAKDANDDRTLTIGVPMALRKHGGRKRVLAPQGETPTVPPRRIDSATVKLLARAFRWRKLIETGTYANAAEIARVEGVNDSYVSRILRLTLLAPDIIEAVIDGRYQPAMTVQTLTKPFPVEWAVQFLSLSARLGPSRTYRDCACNDASLTNRPPAKRCRSGN
jgi:hypothetical protein